MEDHSQADSYMNVIQVERRLWWEKTGLVPRQLRGGVGATGRDVRQPTPRVPAEGYHRTGRLLPW